MYNPPPKLDARANHIHIIFTSSCITCTHMYYTHRRIVEMTNQRIAEEAIPETPASRRKDKSKGRGRAADEEEGEATATAKGRRRLGPVREEDAVVEGFVSRLRQNLSESVALAGDISQRAVELEGEVAQVDLIKDEIDRLEAELHMANGLLKVGGWVYQRWWVDDQG